MEHFLGGVHQFRTQVFDQEKDFFQELVHGQNPSALVVSCSDSRVDLNLILQAAPGDLFSLRNAGNLVPPFGASNGGETASIEYAVVALDVKDIVVCGHSQCGAMKALLDPASAAKLPTVQNWLQHAETTRRIISENYQHLDGVALLEATIQEHVLVQIENLQTHPSVAAKMQRGELRLHAWVYQLETGSLLAFSSETETFEPLGTEGKAIGDRPRRSPGTVRKKNPSTKRPRS
ncbi:carbonic anhydrase [bacterium]|nr:carbonic anhydrase [bacterium]